jgi:hypothetical protein
MPRMLALALALAACGGAQPNQPFLANAPRPNPAAVAGGAAAAAAAMTLATDGNRPEKPGEKPLKEQKVKEHVTPDVLDRLDHSGSGAEQKPAQPAAETKKADAPKDALDFSKP